MRCKTSVCMLACLALPNLPVAQAPTETFKPGMIITRSVKIRPGRYLAPAGDSGAITVRGSNITVDLRGVELVGSDDRHHPDTFTGTAIRIAGGTQVTVRRSRWAPGTCGCTGGPWR